MVGEDYFLEVGVPEAQLDECYRWAFGDDVDSSLFNDLGSRWRQLHSDLFVISDSDELRGSFNKIGKAFLEKK